MNPKIQRIYAMLGLSHFDPRCGSLFFVMVESDNVLIKQYDEVYD